jgi:hypothetical protein
MRRQAVGQRFSAFENAQNVEHQGAERLSIGELGGDRNGAVERDAGVEQRGKFLGEKKNVFPAPAMEGGKGDLDSFFLFEADVDGSESLAAQFVRDGLIGLGGERAGADFSVGGNGAEVESGRHGKLAVNKRECT